jgi:soluble lytic murein transglycosylase
MRRRILHSFPFLLLLGALAYFAGSNLGFTVRNVNRFYRPAPEERLKAELTQLAGITKVDRQREASVRKIMKVIDRFNRTMPSSLKYRIAETIYEMSIKYENLNIDLICATITHESARTWDPKVRSEKGAMGLMQIMPSTGRFLAQFEGIQWTSAEDVLYDPIKNIRLGCRYLSMLIEFYGIEGGLAAYNGGEKRAAMWLASNKASGVLWKETENYIPAVLRWYMEFQNQMKSGL